MTIVTNLITPQIIAAGTSTLFFAPSTASVSNAPGTAGLFAGQVITNNVYIGNYVGQGIAVLNVGTNNGFAGGVGGPIDVSILTTDVVYGLMYTNSFLTVNKWTNASQVIPFNFRKNGQWAQVLYTAGTAVSNVVSLQLIGRLQNQ